MIFAIAKSLLLGGVIIAVFGWFVCNFYLKYPPWFYVLGIVQRIKNPVGRYVEYDWNFSANILDVSMRTNQSPNIILIIADDLGINDLSGGNGVSTPNIDSIHRDGRRFVNAYAGHATCAPSRAAIFTGRCPTRFGFEFTPVPAPFSYALAKSESYNSVRKGVYHDEWASRTPSMKDMIVPLNETVVAQLLQQRGYDTAYIGKWHLGESAGARPYERGFDKFLGLLPGAGLYLPVGSAEVAAAPVDGEASDDFVRTNAAFCVADEAGRRFTPNKYLTDYFAEQAALAIETQAQRRDGSDPPPLFLVVSFTAPHTPYQALWADYNDPEVAAIAAHKDRVYGAMVRSLDRGVGIVLDAVRRHHRDAGADTLVIFTSDNGGTLYTGLKGVNTPHRGGKGTFFEGGLRVPLLLRWPARLAPGAATDVTAMVAHFDIFATVAAAAGAPLPRGVTMDGTDLLPLLLAAEGRGLSSEESAVGLTCDAGGECAAATDRVARGEHTPHDFLFWRSGHYLALRRGEWKLQVSERPARLWLVHLGRDARERVNLARDLRPDSLHLLQKVPMKDQMFTSYYFYPSDGSRDAASARGAALSQCREVASTVLDWAAVGDLFGVISESEGNASTALAGEFCGLLDRLLRANAEDAVPPLWPSLAEVVVAIDQAAVTSLEDEFVYWQN